jgi:hypothetical protein
MYFLWENLVEVVALLVGPIQRTVGRKLRDSSTGKRHSATSHRYNIITDTFLKLLNQSMDFHKTWYEHHAIRRYPTSVGLNIL